MYSQAQQAAPEATPEAQEATPETPEEEPAIETEGGTADEPAPEVNAETKQESALLGMVGGITGALTILQALSAGQIARESAVRLFSLFIIMSRLRRQRR